MRRRTATGRIIAMAALMIAAILGISTATHAQQCCTATITNNTDCPITICIKTMNGVQCTQYAANSSQVVNVPCVAFHVFVRSCGQSVEVPPGGCVNPAHLQGDCCAEVCFDLDSDGCYTITANDSPMTCDCL